VYTLTEEGKRIREEAEEAADRYFFAPWAYLNDGEWAQSHHPLIRLKIGLQDVVESDRDE